MRLTAGIHGPEPAGPNISMTGPTKFERSEPGQDRENLREMFR